MASSAAVPDRNRMSISWLTSPSPPINVSIRPATRASSTTSSADDPMPSAARPPRPAYSEEQRFFIMHTRVVLNLSWHEIEARYAQLFGQDLVRLRSRGGLTSVYYRIRKRWGMEEVLKTAPESSYADKVEVLRRVGWMPGEFLAKMQSTLNMQC
ncbi:hypothetical protein LTR53_008321 [Teratosphaeriaceae sp. CCFEE 6253]|nr:hypothetical protein LTR53_008321 [Teratosphaeriaceae sp. CCFEE 6253]